MYNIYTQLANNPTPIPYPILTLLIYLLTVSPTLLGIKWLK